MSIHLQKELDQVKLLIQSLAGKVEEAVNKAVQAVLKQDIDLAKEVYRNDNIIDRAEIELEEECLKILALYQPVATDLRYVVSCLKINNDLERIGDLAAKMAKRVKIVTKSEVSVELDIPKMMKITQRMLRKSLDALFSLDAEQAKVVCEMDTEVDDLKSKTMEEIKNLILNDHQNIEVYLQFMGLARGLERIADYATNISEDVIYMLEGKIVRHLI